METHFRRVDLPEGGTACQLCSGNTGRVFIERSQQVVCLDCGRDIAQAMSAFDPPKPPESEKDRSLRAAGTYLDANPEFAGVLADFIAAYERRRNAPPETVTASPVEETARVIGATPPPGARQEYDTASGATTIYDEQGKAVYQGTNPPAPGPVAPEATKTGKGKTTPKKSEGWQKRGGGRK